MDLPLRRLTLANGLRMVHLPDPDTKMVVLNLLYDVGSRDEQADCTGLAHLFEHLMFGGSKNVPSYDGVLQQAGGRSNAWTSCDYTNYYDVLPAQNAATAFRIESDRLLGLRLDEEAINIQKSVVIEEFKQTCLNRPFGDLWHEIRAAAYQVHPYRWPTIGITPEHVANAPVESIRNFFTSHYAPNNLVLCVAGNIGFDEAARLTEEWFADIPSRPVAARQLPQEPEHTEPVERVVAKNAPFVMVTRVWHMCPRKHPDFAACDILSDVLANGKSSRFTRNVLSHSRNFAALDAFIHPQVEGGLFAVQAVLEPNMNVSKAIEEVDAEMNKLILDGITDYELKKYVNKYAATHTLDNLNYRTLATHICTNEMEGAAEDFFAEPEVYARLTVDHVNEVARRMLRPENSATVIYGK